jgi:hypothetical protein
MAFLAEPGVNLTLQTGGLSGGLITLDIAAQCLNVEMCAYLVMLDVLARDDAPYNLINAVDARNAMDSRSLAIVYDRLSRGAFDPDVVSSGGDSFCPTYIVRRPQYGAAIPDHTTDIIRYGIWPTNFLFRQGVQAVRSSDPRRSPHSR